MIEFGRQVELFLPVSGKSTDDVQKFSRERVDLSGNAASLSSTVYEGGSPLDSDCLRQGEHRDELLQGTLAKPGAGRGMTSGESEQLLCHRRERGHKLPAGEIGTTGQEGESAIGF